MIGWTPDPDHVRLIDAQAAGWQQGDAFDARSLPVLRIVDPLRPLTRDPAEGGGRLVAEEHDRVIVVSQTCDIVRTCEHRPLLTIAPLVMLDGEVRSNAAGGRIPRHVAVGAAQPGGFADLDQVTTVEKSVLIDRFLYRGCSDDETLRAFGRAVARHVGRYAFPDDFTLSVGPLVERLRKRSGKDSSEGRRVGELREIRVRAVEGWTHQAEVELIFVVSRDSLTASDVDADDTSRTLGVSGIEDVCSSLDSEEDPAQRTALWAALVEHWADMCCPQGQIGRIIANAVTIDELSAAAYLASDPLDLDHLSSSL